MKDNLCSKIIPVVFMFCICFIAFQIESVKAWQASFEGCSRIKCDNAGIEKDGKWVDFECLNGEAYIEFKDDASKYTLPTCNIDDFKGWILVFSEGSGNYGRVEYTLCSDKDSLNGIKEANKCNKPVIFNGKFTGKFNHDTYSSVHFQGYYEENSKVEHSSYIDIDKNGSNEHNFENDSVVSCGPSLLDDIPSMVPFLIHIIYLILQLIIPIILVIMGILDLVKSLTGQKDDEIKKGQRTFIKRVITGVIIFFIFSIVKLVISLVGDDNNESILNCVDCFINNNNSCIR